MRAHQLPYSKHVGLCHQMLGPCTERAAHMCTTTLRISRVLNDITQRLCRLQTAGLGAMHC